MSKLRFFFKRIAILALANCLVVGLALAQGESKPAATPTVASEADAVRARVAERWAAIFAKDVDKVYSLLSAGQRQVMSKEVFANTFKLESFKAAEAKEVNCDGDVCRVNVAVRVAVRIKGRGNYDHDSQIQETWRKADGTWWYIPIVR